MMVATAPTDGYRSVGVAPVMTGKANATPTTDELETSANIAPLTTMDGVNEKGLSAAILQIHRWQAPNDGKPSISQLAVVRLLLDKAATVDEAISLLGGTTSPPTATSTHRSEDCTTHWPTRPAQRPPSNSTAGKCTSPVLRTRTRPPRTR